MGKKAPPTVFQFEVIYDLSITMKGHVVDKQGRAVPFSLVMFLMDTYFLNHVEFFIIFYAFFNHIDRIIVNFIKLYEEKKIIVCNLTLQMRKNKYFYN